MDKRRNAGSLPTVTVVHPTISRLLAEDGVITVADHPHLRTTLSRLTAAGVLTRPMPGTFVARSDPTAFLRAVCAWSGPEGVLHDRTAAALWLPGQTSFLAQLAHPRLRSRRGVTVWRYRVPREFVRTSKGIRFTSPAYAAVELAATDDGRAVCEALRRGLATTAELKDALWSLNGTNGQAVRRCVVEACLTNPWSYAELRLHRILREAGITGWVANRRLRLGGVVVHPDVLFPGARVVIEFDGRAVHDDPAQFLKDRERQNVLVTSGYLVLRFGWEHLDQPDYIVSVVRHALRCQAQ